MASKRPLSGEIPTSSNSSHQVKKVKAGASGKDSLTMNLDPIHADLRTAIHIKKALDNIVLLQRLGYCPTKVQKFRKDFDLDIRTNSPVDDGPGSTADKEVVDRVLVEKDNSSGGPIARVKCPKNGFRSRDIANQVILDQLRAVSKDMNSLSTSESYTCGEFKDFSFRLRITRPECEFKGSIGSDTYKIDDLLPHWFEHSAISGYGDMQSLETKVDAEVRNAREIPASEFKVKSAFLKKIQDKWGEHFLPRKVRAVPYKIHLYGPGGHFKSHRDTPETGLVGTFLVGLGDTSSTREGNFRIGDETLRAERVTWIAFHPDIPHEITKLEDGYRAVMAFKIMGVNDKKPDVLPAQFEDRVKKILDQIPAPFGLLTAHQYSIGTTSLNGFDALLLAYARSRNNIQAHMLPVVTTFYAEAFGNDDPEEDESYTRSCVYPFTRAHVDILLERNVVQAKKEVEWLRRWSGIPFYAWDLASLEAWKEDYPDGANYTGNEADSDREDSIYLAHTILFLPETPSGMKE